jgi:hypothetical protein
MINKLATLRQSALVGVSAIALSSVGVSVQAFDLVQNGGFVPSNLSAPSAYVGGGQVTIDNWNISKSYTFLISDGTTFATNINAANYGPDPVWGTPITAPGGGPVTLYGSAGQTVNSPTGSGWYLATDGAYGANAIISQTISGLTVGEQYLLSFYQASAQQTGFNGDSTDYFDVSLGSSTQQSSVMSHPSQAAVTPWQQQTMSFTATSATQLLSFVAQGAPNGQPPFALLSSVSLSPATPVPEPVTILGSLAALGFASRFNTLKNKDKK